MAADEIGMLYSDSHRPSGHVSVHAPPLPQNRKL